MISQFINQCCGNNTTIAALLVGVPLVLFVWLGILTFALWRGARYSRALFGDTKKDDLKEILQEHIGRVGVVQTRLNDVEKSLAQLDHKSLRFISKVGIVRFNPFEDTGGDQSFSLALLDESDNGAVVSSLHGRHRTRMYAKPVRGGSSTDYEFSVEEQEAIRKAIALGHK